VTHFTALFDACVLYPAPLRDLLMHLALTDLFRAKWTDQIHILIETSRALGRGLLRGIARYHRERAQ